ncbi:MAG: endolytic transglycosylase MltG [Clostridiaceae bacterium]|nr:endolytic transglycosylase MltG [Clostridiaceae bacterium]
MDSQNRPSRGSNGGERSRQPRRRKRQRSTGCAGAMLYLIVVVGISVVLSVIVMFAANDVLALVKDEDVVTITVEENTTASALSKQLDQTGIVNYGSLFNLFLKVTDKNVDILAGTYELSPAMDYNQIVRALRNADQKKTVKVTIPEGYSLEQIKELLIENSVCSESELDQALNEYAFKHDFLEDELPPEEGWLEGYLFPDTYTFYQSGDAVKGVVNRMLNNFDDHYDESIQEGAKELDCSISEIVTIASLVEREAKVADEFPMIAGVIHNRLNSSKFPRLEIDASVLYGLGRTSGSLSKKDLKTDTPYNTYLHEGLPPGPICNPGYNALYAASHPSEHDYYFYVAMPDGSHLFATTNSEHEENKARAAEAFAEAEKSEEE